MKYTFNNNKIESNIVLKEFFPLIVSFSDVELNNSFIEFNYKDTDMVELSVNSKTHIIKQLTLTLVNHYSFIDECTPIPDYEEGAIFITGPHKTECSSFLVSVYNDGLIINMSQSLPKLFYKCGNIIFAFSAHDELSAIYIVDLKQEELNHVRNELLNN